MAVVFSFVAAASVTALKATSG